MLECYPQICLFYAQAAPLTRGSLSCRKMERQAEVLETGDTGNPRKMWSKLGFNNFNFISRKKGCKKSFVLFVAFLWIKFKFRHICLKLH